MIQCGIPVRTMLYSVTDRLDFWLSSSVLVYRSWMLALRGINVHTAGYWIHEAGYRIHKAGYRIHQVGYRIHQAGYMIHRNWMPNTSKLDTVHQAGYRIHQAGYSILYTSSWIIGYRIHQAGYMIHRDWMHDTSKAGYDTGYSELNKCYIKSEGSTFPSDLLIDSLTVTSCGNKARND